MGTIGAGAVGVGGASDAPQTPGGVGRLWGAIKSALSRSGSESDLQNLTVAEMLAQQRMVAAAANPNEDTLEQGPYVDATPGLVTIPFANGFTTFASAVATRANKILNGESEGPAPAPDPLKLVAPFVYHTFRSEEGALVVTVRDTSRVARHSYITYRLVPQDGTVGTTNLPLTHTSQYAQTRVAGDLVFASKNAPKAGAVWPIALAQDAALVAHANLATLFARFTGTNAWPLRNALRTTEVGDPNVGALYDAEEEKKGKIVLKHPVVWLVMRIAGCVTTLDEYLDNYVPALFEEDGKAEPDVAKKPAALDSIIVQCMAALNALHVMRFETAGVSVPGFTARAADVSRFSLVPLPRDADVVGVTWVPETITEDGVPTGTGNPVRLIVPSLSYVDDLGVAMRCAIVLVDVGHASGRTGPLKAGTTIGHLPVALEDVPGGNYGDETTTADREYEPFGNENVYANTSKPLSHHTLTALDVNQFAASMLAHVLRFMTRGSFDDFNSMSLAEAESLPYPVTGVTANGTLEFDYAGATQYGTIAKTGGPLQALEMPAPSLGAADPSAQDLAKEALATERENQRAIVSELWNAVLNRSSKRMRALRILATVVAALLAGHQVPGKMIAGAARIAHALGTVRTGFSIDLPVLYGEPEDPPFNDDRLLASERYVQMRYDPIKLNVGSVFQDVKIGAPVQADVGKQAPALVDGPKDD